MRFDVTLPGATNPTAWKLVFGEQKAPGGLPIWMEPFDVLRLPKVYNLRMDPYERADVGPTNSYYRWETENVYLTAEGVRRAAAFLHTFVEYPPSQTPASFSIDQVVKDIKRALEEKK
jgi:hypothetical protein